MHGKTSAIRFSEAQKLLDYGFNNFEYIEFSKKNDFLKKINVEKGIKTTVNAVFENDSGFLVKKGESKNIETNIIIPETISAPVDIGQKIGEVTYSLNGEIISHTNIVSMDKTKKLSFFNMTARLIENWFTLFR